MHSPRLIHSILTAAVANESPILGSRLKQLLVSKCIATGSPPFDEGALGYSKFSDYLEAEHGDILYLDRVSNPSDVLVRSGPAAPLAGPRMPKIKGDVWQAFTNPDPNRKRFFNKETWQVKHFLDASQGSSDGTAEPQLSTADIEVDPIAAETHKSWMKEYVESIKLELPEPKASELIALSDQPYTSQLNRDFTKQLGKHASGWRQYRTKKIVEAISHWAERNDVPTKTLYAYTASPQPRVVPGDAIVDQTHIAPREKAWRLLDLLKEDEIAELVLPTLLSAIAVTVKR